MKNVNSNKAAKAPRFSKVLSKAVVKANKDKDVSSEIKDITAIVKAAMKAYSKKDVKKRLKKCSEVKVDTVRGEAPLAILDDASLLAVVKTEHGKIVQDILACVGEDEDVTSEIQRAMSKSKEILGAIYWLNTESEGSELF